MEASLNANRFQASGQFKASLNGFKGSNEPRNYSEENYSSKIHWDFRPISQKVQSYILKGEDYSFQSKVKQLETLAKIQRD
jgi:hypothetical protein